MHHAGGGSLRGIWVSGDGGFSVGKGSDDLRLAGVRESDDGHLGGAGFFNLGSGTGGSRLFIQGLSKIGEFGTQVGAEVVGALVLGHDGQHFFQPGYFLLGGLGGAEIPLRFKVLRRKISRHG